MHLLFILLLLLIPLAMAEIVRFQTIVPGHEAVPFECGVTSACRTISFCYDGIPQGRLTDLALDRYAVAIHVDCSELIPFQSATANIQCISRMEAEDSISWFILSSMLSGTVSDLIELPQWPNYLSSVFLGIHPPFQPYIISPFGTTCFTLDERILITRGNVTIHPMPEAMGTMKNIAAGIILAALTPKLASVAPFYFFTGGVLGATVSTFVIVLAASWLISRRAGVGIGGVNIGVSLFSQIAVTYLRTFANDFIRSYLMFILTWIGVAFIISAISTRRWMMMEDGTIRVHGILSDTMATFLRVIAAYLMTDPIRYYSLWRAGSIAILVIILYAGSRWRCRGRGKSSTPPPREGGFTVKGHEKKYMSEEEYKLIGITYTDMQMKNLIRPDRARTEEEQSFMKWICANHMRIQLSGVPGLNDIPASPPPSPGGDGEEE